MKMNGIPSGYRAALYSPPYVLVADEGQSLNDPNVLLYQWDLVLGRFTDMGAQSAQVWLKFLPYAEIYDGDGTDLLGAPN